PLPSTFMPLRPLDSRSLHSFPTRRSSDLVRAEREAARGWVRLGVAAGPEPERGIQGVVARSRQGLTIAPCHVLWSGPADSGLRRDRKSTRLNSSHVKISYAVFCLKKKNNN